MHERRASLAVPFGARAPTARKLAHARRGAHVADVGHGMRCALLEDRREKRGAGREDHVREARVGRDAGHPPPVVCEAAVLVERAEHGEERLRVLPVRRRRWREPR